MGPHAGQSMAAGAGRDATSRLNSSRFCRTATTHAVRARSSFGSSRRRSAHRMWRGFSKRLARASPPSDRISAGSSSERSTSRP
eukprot:3119425-Prymnesium_polylepis.1